MAFLKSKDPLSTENLVRFLLPRETPPPTTPLFTRNCKAKSHDFTDFHFIMNISGYFNRLLWVWKLQGRLNKIWNWVRGDQDMSVFCMPIYMGYQTQNPIFGQRCSWTQLLYRWRSRVLYEAKFLSMWNVIITLTLGTSAQSQYHPLRQESDLRCP